MNPVNPIEKNARYLGLITRTIWREFGEEEVNKASAKARKSIDLLIDSHPEVTNKELDEEHIRILYAELTALRAAEVARQKAVVEAAKRVEHLKTRPFAGALAGVRL